MNFESPDLTPKLVTAALRLAVAVPAVTHWEFTLHRIVAGDLVVEFRDSFYPIDMHVTVFATPAAESRPYNFKLCWTDCASVSSSHSSVIRKALEEMCKENDVM